MKKISLLPTLCIVSFTLHAQPKILNNFKIRQSFQSEDTKPEPAIFSFTKPDTGKSSYLIDAAVGFSLPKDSAGNPNNTFTIFAEYHRNTLVDKEQNTIQGGLSFEWFVNPDFNPDCFTWVSTNVIKYSHNVIDTTHSIQASTEWTPLFLRGNNCHATSKLLPNDENNAFGNILAYAYYPSIGIEEEYRLDAPADSLKGEILRGLGKILVSIYPAHDYLNRRLELYFNGTARYDLINTISSTSHWNPLIQTGLNIVLIKSKKASVKLGLSYNSGADPSKGLKDQKYYLATLKIKL